MKRCDYNKFPGWICSRERKHDGPCALRTYWSFAWYLAGVYARAAYAGALALCGLFVCERCRYLLPRRLRTICGYCRECYKAVIFRRH